MARRRADGTIRHPYSALNLRLALAVFGLVAMLAVALLAWFYDNPPIAVLALVIAGLAAINVAVVQVRRRQRRREEPPDVNHSLFE